MRLATITFMNGGHVRPCKERRNIIKGIEIIEKTVVDRDLWGIAHLQRNTPLQPFHF
jgi:hypothetical protein